MASEEQQARKVPAETGRVPLSEEVVDVGHDVVEEQRSGDRQSINIERMVKAGTMATGKPTGEQARRPRAEDATAAVDEAARAANEERAELGRVKLTVNLPEREMAVLRRIAARRDISITDAVRRAIAMEQFIEETQAEGGKLLVEQPDHTIRQLVVR
jgi:hypothetical protein